MEVNMGVAITIAIPILAVVCGSAFVRVQDYERYSQDSCQHGDQG